MSSNYAFYRYVIILLPHIETNFYMVPIQLRLRNAFLLAEIIGWLLTILFLKSSNIFEFI